MKKKNNYKNYILPAVWAILALISLLVNMSQLKFPVVKPVFVAVYFLPAILFTAFFTLPRMRKEKLRKILKVLLILLLIPSVIASIFVFIPGYPSLSKTTEPKNYLVTDGGVYEQSEYYGLFPGKIPASAQDIKYEYKKVDSRSWCIGAQWTLPEAEYEQEKARILSLCSKHSMVEIKNEQKSTYYTENENDTAYFRVVFFEGNHMISYVYARLTEPEGFSK